MRKERGIREEKAVREEKNDKVGIGDEGRK